MTGNRSVYLLLVFAALSIAACESSEESIVRNAEKDPANASPIDDHSELSGLWYNDPGATRNWPSTAEVPITPTGQGLVDSWAQDEDPMLGCIIGFGRIVSAPFPMELLIDGDRATILYEYDHQIRRIYMDGRGHPDDLYPTLMGHSVGYWENGVLVVDTIGLEGSYFRPSGALPYSDSAQITERYSSLPGGKQLQIEFTVTDSDYYQEPWSVIWTYSPAADILEYRCIVREHLLPESGSQ